MAQPPDAVDARLLALLAEVGRVAVHDLAARAGLDVREVAARLAALAATGLPLVVGVECDQAALRYALQRQAWAAQQGTMSGPHQVHPQPSYQPPGHTSGPQPVQFGPQSGPNPVQSGPVHVPSGPVNVPSGPSGAVHVPSGPGGTAHVPGGPGGPAQVSTGSGGSGHGPGGPAPVGPPSGPAPVGPPSGPVHVGPPSGPVPIGPPSGPVPLGASPPDVSGGPASAGPGWPGQAGSPGDPGPANGGPGPVSGTGPASGGSSGYNVAGAGADVPAGFGPTGIGDPEAVGTWGPPQSATWARGDHEPMSATTVRTVPAGRTEQGPRRTGKVGETLFGEGLDGERVSIQLVEVVDPADFLFTAAGYRLQPGERSVVVHTELTNRGAVPFSSLPDLYLVLVDVDGAAVSKAPVSLSSRPPHRIGVQPGETAGGHTVYVLPEGTELASVRWSPRPDDDRRVLIWTLQDQG